jgi:hypothetical protein
VFADAHPDVKLYVASLDSHLDEDAYIVPGLGDAGIVFSGPSKRSSSLLQKQGKTGYASLRSPFSFLPEQTKLTPPP